ncbi:MAG: menaquinone biosynthesis protein [Nitrospira sp.]|nr:menaquinone biosynthesis protein [Nitrospira sp.]
MKDESLIIGRIPYANLYPMFYYLHTQISRTRYKFISGVPSTLNRLLREGRLDISPSSSVEFLQHRNDYEILPWFSVSSCGEIRSILLFSTVPIEKLNGQTIAISTESDTSTMLLKIILNQFYSIKCKFQRISGESVRTTLTHLPAVMHIGDTALIEAKNITQDQHLNKENIHIYDLGEIWQQHTSLPFVYALWVARKDLSQEKKSLLNALSRDLLDAKEYMRENLPLIAREAPQKEWLGEKELLDYWNLISYDLTKSHMEGLTLFDKYAKKLNAEN